MKLNIATLKAAEDMGLNRAQIEEYVNDGRNMSAETRALCHTCLQVGQLQGDMTDEEYLAYSEQEPHI